MSELVVFKVNIIHNNIGILKGILLGEGCLTTGIKALTLHLLKYSVLVSEIISVKINFGITFQRNRICTKIKY